MSSVIISSVDPASQPTSTRQEDEDSTHDDENNEGGGYHQGFMHVFRCLGRVFKDPHERLEDNGWGACKTIIFPLSCSFLLGPPKGDLYFLVDLTNNPMRRHIISSLLPHKNSHPSILPCTTIYCILIAEVPREDVVVRVAGGIAKGASWIPLCMCTQQIL